MPLKYIPKYFILPRIQVQDVISITQFDRTLELIKMRQDVPVPIILILKVHLMTINMKIADMENKGLCLLGSLVQIEASMKGRCLALSIVLVA